MVQSNTIKNMRRNTVYTTLLILDIRIGKGIQDSTNLRWRLRARLNEKHTDEKLFVANDALAMPSKTQFIEVFDCDQNELNRLPPVPLEWQDEDLQF